MMRHLLALVTLLALFAACGSGSSGADTVIPAPAADAGNDAASAPSTGTGSDAGPGFDAAPPAFACQGKEHPSTDTTWKVTWKGVERDVILHVPKSYNPGVPMPVILNFHGFTSDAPQEQLLTGMNDKSDTAGFIAVYPQGTGTAQSWNAGACCGEAMNQKLDDVGFVGKILDTLEDKLCVDAKRVYATGMSNGGFMSHRLACELSTRIAAVAPVAGVLGIETCNPTRPVPVLHFHGTLDPLVPYDGSAALGFMSVPDTFAGWAKRESCPGQAVETYRKLDAHCSTYDNCAGGSQVTLCTIDGGGHTWPGGLPVPTLGYTSSNLNATDAMWDFFSKHGM